MPASAVTIFARSIASHEKGFKMQSEEKHDYERPSIRRMGSLAELTLGQNTNKYSSSSSDYTYPVGYSFNFS